MPERNYVVFRLLPLFSILLVACSSVHRAQSPAKNQTWLEWQTHQELISTLTHYQTRGSFAYFSKTKIVYARFNWQQISADRYRLIISNPLGSTEINLYVQSDMTKIVNNQGKYYISNDPELLIQKFAGMLIPINNLAKWMLGLPGAATDFSLDSRGYLHQLTYCHKGKYWTVTYKEYHNDTVPPLPSNIELRQSDNRSDNRIKLKIDSWIL